MTRNDLKPARRGSDFSVLGCADRIRVLADTLARVRDQINLDRWPDEVPGIVELTLVKGDLTQIATALVFESASIVGQLKALSFTGKHGDPELSDWLSAPHLFRMHECQGPDCEQRVPIFDTHCDQICAHAAMLEEHEDA